MFDFTESVVIGVPHPQVWEVLSDIDRWWLASNPEPETLEHLDALAPTQVGARLRIREKIGGIPGEADGTITAVDPGTAVTWEADARYRWLKLPIRVGEGVTWRVEPADGSSTRVSARVWATFPTHFVGRLAAFTFVHLLNGVEKDRKHARTELRYLKQLIEGSDPRAKLGHPGQRPG